MAQLQLKFVFVAGVLLKTPTLLFLFLPFSLHDHIQYLVSTGWLVS